MNALETGLYSKLTAASLGVSTRIYNTLAPADATFPCVIFRLVSAVTDDSNTKDGYEFEYDVKAVDRDVDGSKGPKDAGTVADAIDAALHKQTLTVSGWTNVAIRRVARLKYHDGECWHVGGTYRLWVQEA